jgi:hypothetical protein
MSIVYSSSVRDFTIPLLVSSAGAVLLRGFQTSLERGGNNIALPVTDVIGGELDA